jgi:hypothetical protein
MQDQQPLNPAEQELEAALRELRPVSAGIDRDAVLFKAGYQSALRQMRVWQSVAGALAASLLISFIMPAFHTSREQSASVTDAPSHVSQAAVALEPLEVEITGVQPVTAGWFGVLDWMLRPGDVTPAVAARANDYLSVRQAVLTHGLDALRTPVGDGVVPRRQNMQRLLDLRPEDVGGEAAFKFITRNLGGDKL